MQMNLLQKISKLIPHYGEDLISFPLWEEGVYDYPVITLCYNKKVEEGQIDGYNIDVECEKGLCYITIYPEIEFLEDGSYKYDRFPVIEEMIDVAIKIIGVYESVAIKQPSHETVNANPYKDLFNMGFTCRKCRSRNTAVSNFLVKCNSCNHLEDTILKIK